MSHVTRELCGNIAVLRYMNPPLGTMTNAGSNEMLAAVRRAESDGAVRCVVITGGLPGVFVRHYDVQELVELGKKLASRPTPPRVDHPPTGGFNALVDCLASMRKPVIAAINGCCMGGGLELALACDLRIAGRDVGLIGLPETRIGLFPGGGGTQRLPRIVGEARALEMILRGRVVDAEEAASIGLVHEVAEDAITRALEIASDLAMRPAEGLALAKRLIRGALNAPLPQGLMHERELFLEVVRHSSAIEAMELSLADAPLGTCEPS